MFDQAVMEITDINSRKNAGAVLMVLATPAPRLGARWYLLHLLLRSQPSTNYMFFQFSICIFFRLGAPAALLHTSSS